MECTKDKAIRIATDFLAKLTIDEGSRVIEASFKEWVKYIGSQPRGSHLSYEDRYAGGQSTNSGQVPIVDLDNLDKDKLVTVLATEWCYRMHLYQDSIRAEHRDRVDLPSSMLGGVVPQSLFDAGSNLAVNEALSFWAIVTVEWARRCSVKGITPERGGYQIPPGVDRDEWMTQFLTWSMGEGFHVYLE